MLRSHLNRSADSATSLSELAERMGVSRREAEQAVQDARMAGEPIVSGPRGLWIGTDAEALEWCERARSRALNQLATVQAVQRGVERRRGAGQLSWMEAA